MRTPAQRTRHPLIALALPLLLVGAAWADEAPPRAPLVPAGEDLAPNSGLEEGAGGAPTGWGLHSPSEGLRCTWVGDAGIESSKGLLFEGETLPPGERTWASATQTLGDLPPEAALELTVWLRLTGYEGFALVWGRCDGPDGVERHEGAYDNSKLQGYALEGTTIWSPVTIRLTTSEETRKIVWGLLVRGTGEVRMDEARVRVRERTVAPARSPTAKTGPGLYRALGRYKVLVNTEDESLRVLVPVPILWRDQVPLDFRVWSEPEGHVASVRLLRRDHGFHVAEIRLEGLSKGEEIRVSWDGHVLAFPHMPSDIPEGVTLPLADVPEDVRPWLAATWCCDAKSDAIEAVARDIREAGTTADVVVPATLARMKEIFRAAEGHVEALTADEALTKRGSCTSCANLGAALLRAHGIPARVIAGYPTWSGPLQTHYVVEYWLPEGGWRLMESTRCVDDRPGWEQIEVAMVLPEDEVEEKAGRRKGAAGGVPWLSLTEYPDSKTPQASSAYLAGATEKRACDHQAVKVALFEASDDAWAEAAATLAVRWRRLTAAAVESPVKVEGLARPDVLPGEIASLEALLEALK